jgi:putative membrane protein
MDMPPMEIAAKVLVGLVALIHVYIALLESVLFRSRGVKVFKLTPERADIMAPAMANQGLYNFFLAVALALGLFWPDPPVAQAFVLYGLGCVIAAGIVGALTVMPSILLVQAIPAVAAAVVYALAYGLIG